MLLRLVNLSRQLIASIPMPSSGLIGLLIIAMGHMNFARAQSSSPEFGIREDEPRTGSIVKRRLVWGASIPINRKYHELTAEEKARLSKLYESMAPGDEPPFPADGLKPIFDAIHKGQQKLLVEGELILLATVAASGEVQQIKAIGSPSPEMTQYAARVLLLTKFKPAVCQGVPCRMDYPFLFDFVRELR